MAHGQTALRQIHIGAEATAGTGVAATIAVNRRSGNVVIDREDDMLEDLYADSLARSMYSPVRTRNMTRLDGLTVPLAFDELLLSVLSSGVRTALVTTPTGATNARLWTFTPSLRNPPTIQTYTIEFSERDGTNTWGREARYGFTTGFSITQAADGLSELSFDMVARKALSGTPTSLTEAADRLIPNALWKFYDNTTWATLGTTEVAGQILTMTISWSDWLEPDWAPAGRTDLDFRGLRHKGGRRLEVSGTARIDPASTGWVTQHRTHIETNPQERRFMRFEVEGPQIDAAAGANPAINHKLSIDGCFVHAPGSMTVYGEDEDGSSIISFNLISRRDTTAPNDVRFLVVSNLAALS